jgi:hypothetical protein
MTDYDNSDRNAKPIDTGEPIQALRDLEEKPSDSFMISLHHRIQRRLLAADIGRLTWSGVIEVMIEFFSLIFGLIGVRDRDERKE